MITSTYLRQVTTNIVNDIHRVTVNDKEAEIINTTRLNNTQFELTLRPLDEIPSLSSVKLYNVAGQLMYSKPTNVNIQDMYNIELKIRIGVQQHVQT